MTIRIYFSIRIFFLTGKVICRNVCDLNISWDKKIPRGNQNQWLNCTRDVHNKIKLPGSIPIKEKQISYIDIHLFGDASLTGV